MPDTVLVAHLPGWVMLDKLYALNFTLYVVTDDPTSDLDRTRMISAVLGIANGPVEAASGCKRIKSCKL